MEKRKYTAPSTTVVDLDLDATLCVIAGSMPVDNSGATEFDAPQRRNNGWEDYEK